METKLCKQCCITKPISEFYNHKIDGHVSPCKDCRRASGRTHNKTPERQIYNKKFQNALKDSGYFKEYYQRPDVKKRKRDYMRAYSKRPDVIIRDTARRILRTYKENGRIVQQPCAVCGAIQSEGHHSDYDKPLLVVWLCRGCHNKEHVKLNNAKAKGE